MVTQDHVIVPISCCDCGADGMFNNDYLDIERSCFHPKQITMN